MAGTSRKKQDTGSRKKQAGTAGTKRSGTGRKKTAPAVNENSFMGTEVAIIVSFAVSVLLFLSNFGLCGAVGDFCRKVMLGIFGSMGYAAPVLLFLGTCFYMSNRGNYRAFLKMGAVAVVLLVLCGLDQMMFGGGMKEGWKLSQYYVQSGAGGDGGGFAGGALVMILSSALGSVGTYLVLIVALVLGAVCITEKSLVSLVKKGSGRAYEYAREDMNRRREIHEERREERRRMREEQRVRGVDLDATNLNDVPLMREFAAGIPEGTVLAEDAGQEFQEDDRQFQTDGKDREASAGRPQNPADIFRGSIALPQYDPEADMEEAEETGQAEAKAAASDETGKRRKSRKGSPQEDTDDILKNIYVRRDTRTFEEFSGEEREIGGRHPGFTAVPAEDYGETEVPWENTDARDVYDSEVRPEPFGEPYPEAGHFDDSEQVERFYEDCEGTEPYGSAKAYYREEDLSVNGSDSEQEEGLNYDGFYIPEEPKTVVTASGKIIETDTEMVRKTIEKKRVEKKSQPEDELSLNEQIEKRAEAAKVVKKEYIVPPLNLLKKGAKNSGGFSEKEYKETAIKLQQTLQNFGVGVTVTNISCGPSVTRYELHPEQGVKVSKIVALSDDIKLNLAAAGVCSCLGLSKERVAHALEHMQVDGRMEIVYKSAKCTVIVDYAHNAVSMESLLMTLRDYKPKRLVVVFGCGGNRARDRRYSMGEIGGKLADLSIITADNSRFEKTSDILADIKTGLSRTEGKFIEIPDRREAIEYSLSHAQEGDIIAIIGKGHEDYQEIEGVRHPFLDRTVVQEAVQKLGM